MKIHKLTSTDAFIFFDLDDAPATGITRAARKVLQDGAKLLARSTTYTFASFGAKVGGASAGINADDETRSEAVTAFVEEVAPLVAEGRWTTDPGLGVSEEDLAPLRADDLRPKELWSDGLADDLTARGALAAAAGAQGGSIDDARLAVAGKGPIADRLREIAASSGAEVAGDATDTECDVLFIAGKTGTLDHEAAANVQATVVVPLTPVPVTARAHAVLSQAERIHVPDFLSIAGPLLHAYRAQLPTPEEPIEQIRRAVSELASEGPNLWMAAAARAEEFLVTWQDELPQFRPLG